MTMTTNTRRVVFVVEHEMRDYGGDGNQDFIDELRFISRLGIGALHWSSYCVRDGQGPVRLNISFDGVEEV